MSHIQHLLLPYQKVFNQWPNQEYNGYPIPDSIEAIETRKYMYILKTWCVEEVGDMK